MSLLYIIEQIHYDLKLRNEINWEYVDELHINEDITPKDIKKLIDYFIRNLTDNHQVPGEVYYTLCGIGDYAQSKNDLTSKQMNYVFANIATHWDQLDLFKMT